MLIGLYNIEPKIQNTALMQISHYHKAQGDLVEWYEESLFAKYDKVYCSSIFGFTDKSKVPAGAICGGTGFDLATKLPFDCELDYSLYPDCDRSYIWFSRGCIRDCSFCVVRQKEGRIRPVEPKELNPNGKFIVVQDNNFFASRGWKGALLWLRSKKQPVDFQGIDVRCLSNEKIKELCKVKLYKQIKIAWDNPRDDLRDNIADLLYFIKAYKVMCYVLIGHNSDHQGNIDRVRCLQQFKITPYVMPMNRKDPYQKKFQRWVNGFAYKNVQWEEFKD